MAGPDNQSTKQFFIPIGEAPSVYAPSNIAQQIINFETTIRSTLATVRGPTLRADAGRCHPVVGLW